MFFLVNSAYLFFQINSVIIFAKYLLLPISFPCKKPYPGLLIGII